MSNLRDKLKTMSSVRQLLWAIVVAIIAMILFHPINKRFDILWDMNIKAYILSFLLSVIICYLMLVLIERWRNKPANGAHFFSFQSGFVSCGVSAFVERDAIVFFRRPKLAYNGHCDTI